MASVDPEAGRLRRKRLKDLRVIGENGRWFSPACPPDKHGKASGASYWHCECGPCLQYRTDKLKLSKRNRQHNRAVINGTTAPSGANTGNGVEESATALEQPPSTEVDFPDPDAPAGTHPAAEESAAAPGDPEEYRGTVMAKLRNLLR